MFLKISDAMTVEEVQDRFTECFPFLKLAFYTKPHHLYEGSDKKYQLDGNRRIGSVRKKHTNGVLEIKSWYTTANVEKQLKDMFDLNAQIFRYDAAGCWIQTTFSDVLTLGQLSQFACDGLTANQGISY